MKKTLLACALAFAGALAASAAPNLFTYQGRLKEGGLAVTGNRTVEIFLCDDGTAGTCTTTLAQPVAVTNGLFRSTFTVPAGLSLGSGNWWLEIKIGANTLAPREQLTSNAYALYSATAAYAENISAAPGAPGVLISSNLYVSGGAFTVGNKFMVSTHGVTAIGDFAGVTVDTNSAVHVVGVTTDAQPGVEEARVAFFAEGRSAGSGPEDIIAAGNNEVTSSGSDDAAIAVAVRAKIRREGGAGGTVTNAYGLMVDDINNTEGTLTNTYGVYIGDQTQGAQTNRPYSVYALDSNAPSYFAGFVGVSSETPTAALVISSAAGSSDQMLIVSTGSSVIFGVKGNGEVYTAGKFIGDGSLLINLPAAGGGVSKTGDTMTGQLTVASTATVTGSDGDYGLVVSSGVSLAGIIYTSNGNLGVGTAAPKAALHVRAASGELADLTTNGGSSGGMGFYNDTSRVGYLGHEIAGNNFIGGSLTGSFGLMSNGPLHLIGGNGYGQSAADGITLYSNGAVGMGTTGPRGKLDVIQDDVAVSSYTLVLSTAADRYHVVVTTAGRVGIGDRDPKSMLHIAGSNGDAGVIIDGIGNASSGQWSSGWLAMLRARESLGSQAVVQQDDLLGGMIFLGYDGVDAGEGPFRYGAAIRSLVDGAPTANGADMPGRLEFQTSADDSASLTTRMTIRNDGTVGIGTSAPLAVLDVVSTGTASNIYAQVWRNGGGVVVASMTSDGSLDSGRYLISGSTVLAIPVPTSLSVGVGAGRQNSGVSSNYIGYQAGYTNTSGNQNNFMGWRSGYSNTLGTNNTFVGNSAGWANIRGIENSYYGDNAGYNNSAGNRNSVYGASAGGGAVATYSSAALVGYMSGSLLTSGDGNTLIGYRAGDNLATGSRNIIIGFDQEATASTISDELNIGGVLRGNLAAGTIGIGGANTIPEAALDVMSTGTASNVYVQIWRDSDGTIVSSMTATGVFYGTAGSGDNLGNHTATQDLQMASNNINAVAQLTVSTITGPGTASIFVNQNAYFAGKVGIGITNSSYKFHIYDTGSVVGGLESQGASNAQFFIKNTFAEWSFLNDASDSGKFKLLKSGSAKLTVSADDVGIGTQSPGYRLDVQGGYVNASGGLCIGGNCKSSWASAGDNLGDHTATQNLNLAQFSALNVASVTLVGKGLQLGTDLTGTASGVFISTAGSIQTLGFGNGGAGPATRGHGAVDLQTYRGLTTQAATGIYSAIPGGASNTASGEYSYAMGDGSTASGYGSVVAGGYGGNKASQTAATVSGGLNNTASGWGAVVSGGRDNVASGGGSFIGGGGMDGGGNGGGNKAQQTFAAIAGGTYNIASGSNSFVGGGAYNAATGTSAVVGGGLNNAAGSMFSVVTGGKNNAASNDHAAVGGGQGNTASGTNSVVAGGYYNSASTVGTSIGGGQNNNASGQYSTVGGGSSNNAGANYATVPGGSGNSANGTNSFAAGQAADSTSNNTFTWNDSGGITLSNLVADRTVFKNKGGFVVTGSTNMAMGGTVDRGLFVRGDGLVGIATAAPQAALDVVSNGQPLVPAQIWRNSAGTIVSSMSPTGNLAAASQILKRSGDGYMQRLIVAGGGSFDAGIRWDGPAVFALGGIKVKDMGYAGVDASYAGDMIFETDPGVYDESLVERMRIGFAGGVSMGSPAMQSAQAALDVKSTGTTSAYYAQIWRDSNGMSVGSMTATGTLTAKSFAPGVQIIPLSGALSSIAANGSGVVLLSQNSESNNISAITGCNSGTYAQGQSVTFAVTSYGSGDVTFMDTSVGAVGPDNMVLSSAWAISATTGRGSTITLLCTNIAGTRSWLEVGRSVNTN